MVAMHALSILAVASPLPSIRTAMNIIVIRIFGSRGVVRKIVRLGVKRGAVYCPSRAGG
jgi:hypothetical protein